MNTTASVVEPLRGVRVLDLTTFLSGPLVTRALADLGAEVIKVEPPGGDLTRGGLDQPTSSLWVNVHRGRKSVVLDLKAPAGRRVFLALVGEADVVVENYRPGVTDRLEIGPERLRAVNRRLIYCTITGFGPDGPMADQVAIDGPVQAIAGALELATLNDLEPMPMPITVADIAGASAGAQAVLAALLARERSGEGCAIDVSLFEALLPWVLVNRRASLASPVTQVVEGRDGLRFLVQTPMHFHGRLLDLVATVPGLEAAARDERFALAADAKVNREDYLELMGRAFAARTRDEWLAALRDVGIPAAPVHSIDEALSQPQLAHRQAVAFTATADGDAPVMLSPYRFNGARRTAVERPPRIGEHTAEVLSDVLGYDGDVISDLTREGAFGKVVPT